MLQRRQRSVQDIHHARRELDRRLRRIGYRIVGAEPSPDLSVDCTFLFSQRALPVRRGTRGGVR